jgi:hypothetical protein
MTTSITEDVFETLAAQTGLPLSVAQKETLRAVYPALRAMMDRVSEPLPREAEPALIFVPEVR